MPELARITGPIPSRTPHAPRVQATAQSLGTGRRSGHAGVLPTGAVRGAATLGRVRATERFLPADFVRRHSSEQLEQLLSLARARPDLAWDGSHDIAVARNAHVTNTPAELSAGLVREYDWLEGDVRVDRWGQLVMAHEATDHKGLSLDEWLAVGSASGRGLKIDIKEGAAILPAVELAHRRGVPGSRLIINVTVQGPRGSEITPRQLERVRRLYPDAIVNLSVTAGVYTPDVVGRLARWAVAAGQPVMFPLRYDLLTPAVVAALKPYGRIAVWNSPAMAAPKNPVAESRRLRHMGVNGTIDLRSASGLDRLASPLIKTSIDLVGWDLTVSVLRVKSFLDWLAS